MEQKWLVDQTNTGGDISYIEVVVKQHLHLTKLWIWWGGFIQYMSDMNMNCIRKHLGLRSHIHDVVIFISFGSGKFYTECKQYTDFVSNIHARVRPWILLAETSSKCLLVLSQYLSRKQMHKWRLVNTSIIQSILR